VDEADDSPEGFGIGRSIALFPGAGTHAGFDGEGMLAQTFGLGELRQEVPGGFSIDFIHISGYLRSKGTSEWFRC
jgi:hypothetical protein